jgi:uncharacterized protein
MQGDRLIRRVDARRSSATLHVSAFWPEAGARMGSGRRAALEAEFTRLARLAGVKGVRYSQDWLRET